MVEGHRSVSAESVEFGATVGSCFGGRHDGPPQMQLLLGAVGTRCACVTRPCSRAVNVGVRTGGGPGPLVLRSRAHCLTSARSG